MSAVIDLVGQRFGRLTVVRRIENTPARQARWLAQCDCGNKVRAAGADFRQCKTISCGCVKTERCAKINASHGMRDTAEYTAWVNMRHRCEPNYSERHLYYDRGIRVCDEWAASFSAFLAHVGRKPHADLSLDRINNDGNYQPGNVRWATASEQRRNQRSRVEEMA